MTRTPAPLGVTGRQPHCGVGVWRRDSLWISTGDSRAQMEIATLSLIGGKRASRIGQLGVAHLGDALPHHE